MLIDFIIVFGVLGLALLGIAVLCVAIPVIGIFVLAGMAVLVATVAKPLEYIMEKLR